MNKFYTYLIASLIIALTFGLLIFFGNQSSTDNKEDVIEEVEEQVAQKEEMIEEEVEEIKKEVEKEMPDDSPIKEIAEESIVEDTPSEINSQTKTKMTIAEKTKTPKPELTIDADKKYTAVVHTSEGDVTILLSAKETPNTVNNFVYLANLGFYDDTMFHRVIKGFMIQGGDPLGNGTGGPAYKFEDEISDSNSNDKYTISMANAGPNTNGSQFFINQAANNFLDQKHTVFGQVTKGTEVVEKIAATQTGAQDKPVKEITITSVEIIEE